MLPVPPVVLESGNMEGGQGVKRKERGGFLCTGSSSSTGGDTGPVNLESEPLVTQGLQLVNYRGLNCTELIYIDSFTYHLEKSVVFQLLDPAIKS